MTKDSSPMVEAKPLIEIPKDIPHIGFFGGEAGKEINEAIRKDYKDIKALQIGNYSGNLIKGSSPFYAVAVQSRLPPGMNVATQADLETAMKIGSMDFRNTYEDTGLVLRTEGDPNGYLANNLMKQVKERGKKKMPVTIPLRSLSLERDSSSPHGLAFKLRDDAEIIYAPILNQGNGNFTSEDIDKKTGLPKKLGEGNRTLYTRNSGLSGLYLNRGLNFYSNYDGLANSYDNGRVVVLK